MIRPATIADLRMAAAWIASAEDCAPWAGWRAGFTIDIASLPATVDFQDTDTFSLCEDDRLVAFGQIVGKSASRAHLAWVIVSPEARRQGHGQVLVGALLELAEAEGYDRVSLNVDKANSAAVALYAKLGFHAAERPPDEPDLPGSRYMERTLVPKRIARQGR